MSPHADLPEDFVDELRSVRNEVERLVEVMTGRRGSEVPADGKKY